MAPLSSLTHRIIGARDAGLMPKILEDEQQTSSSADERAFDLLYEPAVSCAVIHAGRGVKRTQSRQSHFPQPVMIVALLARCPR
jgi:hypothetical protein